MTAVVETTTNKRRSLLIVEVLKKVRERKGLSQADFESRTGLVREHPSRVENGRTIPSLPTLEKLAIEMDVPLWEIIRGTNDGSIPSPIIEAREDNISAEVKTQMRVVERAMVRMSARNLKVLVAVARRMAQWERFTRTCPRHLLRRWSS